MLRPSRSMRFVRALLAGGSANRSGNVFTAVGTERATLAVDEVRDLIGSGVLRGDAETCSATAEARGWLKRQMLEVDGFAAQHRFEVRRPDGVAINLAESPLARLAAATKDEAAFLAPHQVEAGERVRRLVERAHLQPRVTMSYSATHTAGGKSPGHAADMTDMAAEARRALAEIPRVLPRDCADVVLDVCGLLKGLQTIETERGWPRRSAKLVLRIGLEQLAQHFGLAPHATGVEGRRRHAWLGEGARPNVFE
jgi:hypothetical protein